jgi:hypothetical protein
LYILSTNLSTNFAIISTFKNEPKDITGNKYQNALNDFKDQGYSDSIREGIHRTGKDDFPKSARNGTDQK